LLGARTDLTNRDHRGSALPQPREHVVGQVLAEDVRTLATTSATA
jgi:hypothetical protein